MSFLEVDRISAGYDGADILRNVSLSLEQGQVKGLIGPSGSGKSSVLRVLVGLLRPSHGTVRLGGTELNHDDRRTLQAFRSEVAIVFQQYNLFQNMTALANVEFAPVHVKKRPPTEARLEAERILVKIGLGDYLGRYPEQLSGGQQQRVAIARALALKPQLLLLDEVTAALDPEMVNEVLDTVALLSSEGITMLIVSHEMSFIADVSDELILMDEGQIIETGSAEEVLRNPTTERGRRFAEKVFRRSWLRDAESR